MSMFSALRTASRASSSLRPLAASASAIKQPRLSPFVRTLVTKKFTTDHEAVIFDDSTNTGTITITDYAQQSLGDVVFVELPAVGTQVAAKEQIGAVESVKAASDIFSPVTGTVEEVNEALGDQPSLINKSPEDKAWLCKIKLTDPKEIDELMDAEAYKAHCESS